METLVGQKRTRDETMESSADDYVSQGKKPCEKLDSWMSSTLSASSDLAEIACLSSTGELSPKAVMAGDDEATDSKVSMAETLRSLEEELGVSGDHSEFLMPSSTIDDLSGSGLVSSWGDVICSTDGELPSVNDVLLSSEAGCSSESSPGLAECFSREDSSVMFEGDNFDTNAKTSSSQKNDKYNPVDIGFLLEASDDELGIPPSPTSDKDQSSEQEQETPTPDTSAENSLNSVEAEFTGNLHDTVGWALEDGDDNVGYSDSGIDEWMMGNLEFMMEGQSAYRTVSPLVEAGIVL